MTPERWKQIREILEPAAELPIAGRAAFLDQKCGSDPDLLAEVEGLLLAEDESGLFEQSPIPLTEPGEKTRTIIGETIGKYQIVGELGSGGMGSVFLARRVDGAFEQTVALKLIKRGMDSDAIVKRFSNERQILASLDHPNIAHLIDGGTTADGQPYFVMEYVSGEPIVDYALSQGLGLSERLDLFRQVCAAVSYAHQNLVIHRDLKPSNILVNTSGVPKLLDFGIAKVLRSAGSGETATRHFVFTPEYASPEQIRGENLTTATDIYSLGVILYELLTGGRPFSYDGKSFGQIIMTATEAEPVKPSDKKLGPLLADHEKPCEPAFAASRLRGDLDNIVLKALRQEPERRYSSVDQFSEDIRRHLRGLPVQARQNTWGYRTRSFVRRNPLLAGSTAAAILILLAGIIATTFMAQRAEVERERAERRFNEVRAIANSLIFEVNEKIEESPIKARELLVSRAIEYLDKLASEADNDTSLQAELAASYEKIGDVQAFHFGSGTGDTAGALENHKKALRIREALVSLYPEDIRYKRDVAASYLKIADLSVTSGKTSEALEKYDLAVDVIRSAHQAAPSDQKVRLELARAYGKLGQGILRSGSISKALENYEKASALMQEAVAVEPREPRVRHGLAVYRSYSGYAKLEMGRLEDALSDFMDALRIDSEIREAEPANVEFSRNYAGSEQWVGVALRHLRRYDESRSHLKNGLEVQLELTRRDGANVGDTNSLADSYLELGWTESDARDLDAAITYLKKSISLYELVASRDPNNLSARRQIAFAKRHLGDAFLRAGNRDEAASYFAAALAENERLIQTDEQNTEFQYDRAICLSRLGELASGDPGRLAAAEKILNTLIERSPDHVQWRADLDRVKRLISSS